MYFIFSFILGIILYMMIVSRLNGGTYNSYKDLYADMNAPCLIVNANVIIAYDNPWIEILCKIGIVILGFCGLIPVLFIHEIIHIFSIHKRIKNLNMVDTENDHDWQLEETIDDETRVVETPSAEQFPVVRFSYDVPIIIPDEYVKINIIIPSSEMWNDNSAMISDCIDEIRKEINTDKIALNKSFPTVNTSDELDAWILNNSSITYNDELASETIIITNKPWNYEGIFKHLICFGYACKNNMTDAIKLNINEILINYRD